MDPAVGTLAHVPIPLCRQNSTLMTVTQRLMTEHSRAGGRSLAILSHNRGLHVDDGEPVYVDYTRYCPRQWFTRRELGLDAAAGWLGRPRPYMSRMFIPAVEAAAAIRPDAVLVYEGVYAAASLPRWSALRPRTRVFLYVHNHLSRTYRHRELASLLEGADGVVVCAGNLRQELEERVGRVPVPVHVVYNGVDEVFFVEAEPRALPRAGELDVVFAGQVAEHKGPHVLLQAMAVLAAAGRVKVRARIVGSGTYAPAEPLTAYERSLRELAERHRLDVTFVPFVDKTTLRSYYRQASVVCVPSVFAEPFGLVAVEAMACRAPVVASGTPGLREAGAQAALYAPPGDASALAACLERLAADPDEQVRRSEAGRRRAGALSWSATYRQLMDVLAAP